MDIQQIEKDAAAIIEGVILTTVEPDTLLIESGLIDSLSAVDVVLGVERRFGVTVPPTEIDVHLESVQTLAQYIAEHAKA